MKSVLIFVQALALNVWANSDVRNLVDTYQVAKAANNLMIEPKEVKDKPYTVQVASHINEKSAIEHAESLLAQEKVVFYYPNFVNSQVFFKVCVGRFESREAAEAYRKEFMKRTNEPFAVTITLQDRPGEDKKATKAQLASARRNAGRMIASLDKTAPIDLKKEATQAPNVANEASATHADANKDMNVQLLPKAAAKVEAKAATAHANPVAVANVAATTASHTWGLQVAAYPTEAMAKSEAAKVNAIGQEVYYKPAEVNGKTWYRVFVGRFNSFSEAQTFQVVYQEQHPGQTIIRKFVN